MAVFEREVEVEVDLDDFDEDEIVEYLQDKGYTVEDNGEPEEPEPPRNRLPYSYTIKRCFDRHQLRTHLENITGCGSYVSNEELLEQLKYLLENG